MANSHATGCQKDDGVDQSDDQDIVLAVAGDAELGREGQVGSIRTGLIPTLGRSSDGTEDDRVPKHEGTMPDVILLVLKSGDLLGKERRVVLEVLWITSDETGPAEEIAVFLETATGGELLGIEHDLLFAETLRKDMVNGMSCR